MGVRTVIDLRQEGEAADVPKGVRYVRIPVSAFHANLVDTGAVLAAIESSPKPVFVHCQHGADRTGCMLGIYRETQQGWDYDKTYKEMLNYGFKPHLVLLSGAVKKRATQGASAH